MVRPDDGREESALRLKLRQLYHGTTPAAQRFQLAILIVDIAIIAFFVVSPVLRDMKSFLWIDYSVAALLTLDIVARIYVASDPMKRLRQLPFLVDIFILVTLLFPESFANWGFLRILRLWTLSYTGMLWRPLERNGLAEWRDTARAVTNLVTFLLVVSGFVYTSFFRSNPGFEGYIDALYVTVATVTTTGFGDIVLPGIWGKTIAIITMLVGISLFVRLAQALFRPTKVFFPCPRCALQRHDPDAVHCKACGELLKIPDYGDS
ncbi:ion channel [Limoniibacter endophyticus]|uniref:Ion transporter n=1 Tax=Limoniibacter endophyticus TaxID=1565040 RepID=A0A8J3GHS6_9HYPH|nr:ion channel [Limoniibacter endophyticus]GHC67975.1 ion transporter [Limoniibacter endophyticus]